MDPAEESARVNAKYPRTPTPRFVVNLLVFGALVLVAAITGAGVGFCLGILTGYVGIEFRNFWIRRNARTFLEKSQRSQPL